MNESTFRIADTIWPNELKGVHGLSTKENKTVLVIDDDKTLRELMEAMLVNLGYHVLLAENGEKALEISGKTRGGIDIAFMDLFLPDMRGDKVGPKIIEDNPGLKVIMMSGYALDDTTILETEVHGFIQKPCSFETLSNILASLN